MNDGGKIIDIKDLKIKTMIFFPKNYTGNTKTFSYILLFYGIQIEFSLIFFILSRCFGLLQVIK